VKELLRELYAMPGVIEACVFEKSGSLFCQGLRSIHSKDVLCKAGTHFTRLLQMGMITSLKIDSCHFLFDRFAVIGIPVDTDIILLILCETNVNSSLIASTGKMLTGEIREVWIDNAFQEDVMSSSRKPLPESVPDLVEEMDESAGEQDMELLYSELEEVLAFLIGPVAAIMMQEVLVRWRKAGTPNRNRLTELIEMLAREIGDVELEKEFISQISHIL
jgi:hypothetical protein